MGNTRPMREVIDGQQRLRTLFDFLRGNLALSRSLHAEWSGKSFDELTVDQQEQLRLTPFHIYQYAAVDDATVLEIFARLNTYSVALNKQELRNGKFFGEFKQLAYLLAREYLEFWRLAKIFSEAAIARMLEAEFVSELLVLQFDGFQDKKASLDAYYAGLDQSWPDEHQEFGTRTRKVIQPRAWLTEGDSLDRFQSTMENLQECVGDLIADRPFRRTPLFYTLYACFYHVLYGLPGQVTPTSTGPLNPNERLRLRTGIEECSVAYDADTNDDTLPRWQRDFAIACGRQTDNVAPRQSRFDILWQRAGIRQ